MNYIKFKFNATEYNGWPKLKFLIDGDLYHDYEFLDNTAFVELPLDLITGNHVLDIELYDKTFNNTLVIDGVIIKDQLVTLEEIFVDNVKVPDFVKYQGIYKVGDTKTPQALTWGVNGTWTLNFEYPIIDWILDQKSIYSNEYIKQDQWATSTYHPKKNQLLKDKLAMLEESIANAKD